MPSLPYIYLAIAILVEVTGTSALKASEGFTRLWPSLIVVVSYAVSFFFMSLTLKSIPVGISYAIWSGVGIVMITVVAWFLYKQALDVPALIGMGLIVAGVAVINLFSNTAGQ
ncbi:MAG TPA: SMR family transporter [Alphaproteobacteria bacterium]|jgi:small multidrug resistance pump|nr:SMR family transporter [Alphaproteobacteria bacterium]